jgi:FemAB-related protein (PEP-CTERM system-associated)
MNAPFSPSRTVWRTAQLDQPDECARIEAFLAAHEEATPFHRPVWLRAVAQATDNRATGILAERHGAIHAWLPLSEVHSPLFGRMLASSGFAVGGGLLTLPGADPQACFGALEELAERLACPAIELRGGPMPAGRAGWQVRCNAHAGFVAPLAADDAAQLLAIPRKQRAEVRKGLDGDLTVEIGRGDSDRVAHYTVYAESVRNLGTPVFPRALFDAALHALDGDILTVRHQGKAVASVLSFYHGGAVMPYWGGGTWDARRLRANDRMYYELMLHARRRGCTRFDFGRSKTGSGAVQV